MNILPLVSAFIILFAIGSYTFVHSMRATVQEKFHYTGALAVERTFANQIQKGIFEAQKGKKADKEEKKESLRDEEREYNSPRDKPPGSNNRKINIKKIESDPLLQKVILQLLKDIYQGTDVYTDNMEYEVLNSIIASLKLHPTLSSFEELLPKIGNTELFYKLIKGTQVYDLEEKKGYPALGDYLTLEGNWKKPINFYHAARPVLKAVFGEKICEQIMIDERLNWEIDRNNRHLTKEKLEPLLKNKFQKNISDYEALLQFTTPSDKISQEIVKDKSSQLQLRINL